jgi:hypothetical protein
MPHWNMNKPAQGCKSIHTIQAEIQNWTWRKISIAKKNKSITYMWEKSPTLEIMD